MSRNIFLVAQSDRLLEMREMPYDSEALLQELLAGHPALLAGDQMSPASPRRWLLVSREMSLPSAEDGGGRWSVDHLFIDQDSVPTIIEVKRSSDTRIRREVVGQMLEYAANAVAYWPLEALQMKWESACAARGVAPEEELANFLGAAGEPEVFWARVKTNLQAGRVRLVFVADEISHELRRIIEFLNQQMDPAEVLGVEIRQFVGQDLRTLVPSVIGQTAEAQQRKGAGATPPPRQWDEGSFFEELASRVTPPEVAVARQLLDWAKPRVTRIYWGKGARSGSFVPVLRHGGVDHQLLAAFTYGSVEVYFQTLAARPAFAPAAKRSELQRRLNAIGGITIRDESLTQRPALKLAVLTQPGSLAQFLTVFDWVVSEIQAQP